MNRGVLPNVRAMLCGASLLGLSGATLACNKSVCGDNADCPDLEVETKAEDAKLAWDSMSTLTLSFEGKTSPVAIIGGGAVFTPTDPSCSADCGYTLKSLHVELDSIVLTTPSSTLRVEALRIGLDPESSVSLPDASGEYVIPAGTKTLACASVDDDPLSTETKLPSSATLVIDPGSETFTFEGELPFEFRTMPNRNCVDHALTLSGTAVGAVPWQQHPGRSDEGADPGAD